MANSFFKMQVTFCLPSVVDYSLTSNGHLTSNGMSFPTKLM